LPGELIRIIIGIAKADRNGQALLNAIKNYDIDEANKLLEKNYIDTNVKNNNGETSLIAAIRYIEKDQKWMEIVKILLQKGANPDLQNNSGNTALDIAVINNLPVIVKILLKKGANIKLQNWCGCTALDIATDFNYTEIVQMLQEQ